MLKALSKGFIVQNRALSLRFLNTVQDDILIPDIISSIEISLLVFRPYSIEPTVALIIKR